MKHPIPMLAAAFVLLSVSGPAHAQTAKKPVAAPKKTPPAATPVQPSLDQAFEAASAQAKADRAKLLAQIRTDQSDASTEALCRISTNQFLLESIDEFETHAADLRRVAEQHRTRIESERDALTRALQEIPGFSAEVLPVESQQKLERQGLAKFNWTSAGQIRISLEQVVAFMELVNARIQYCSKNPETRLEKMEQVTKSLENPYSNPTGLTYSQVISAIEALSTQLNASLKIQNSEFELRFANPVEDQSCSGGLELVQKIKSADGQILRVALKLAPAATPGAIRALHAPQAGQSYPNELVFRSINESELAPSELTFDGYARLSRKLQSAGSNALECRGSAVAHPLTEGFLDSPYLSPQQFLQSTAWIRPAATESSAQFARTNFDFGTEHGLYLDAKKSLWTWGAESGFDTLDRENPVQVVMPSGLGIEQFAAGADHTLLLLSDGSVRYFGINAAAAPIEVGISRSSPVVRIIASGTYNIVIHRDGTIEGFTAGTSPVGIFLPNRELPRKMIVASNTLYVLSQRGRLYAIQMSSQSQLAVAVPGSENLVFDQIDGGGTSLYALTKTGELYGIGTFALPAAPSPTGTILARIPFNPGRIQSIRISDKIGFFLMKDGKLLSVGAGLANAQFAGSLTNPVEVPTPVKKIQRFWFGGGTLWVQEGKQYWGIGDGTEGELGNGAKAASTQFVRPNLPRD